jgi:hypothetical protein
MALPILWTSAFIDLPADGYEEAEAFWLRVLGGRLSDRRGERGEFVTFLPPAGEPYVRAQKVFDGPGGVHLDLQVAPAEIFTAAEAAVELGASVRTSSDDLVVLTSPGGFPFCVNAWEGGHDLPPLLEGPGGAHRLEQVCLDIPPAGYDREVEFWAALTGWELEPDHGDEFRGLPRPAGLPVRLLLQRTADESRPVVTAHLDFACADRDALLPVHLGLGAANPRRFEAWTVLDAPGGHVYCLTRRSPTAPPFPG